jgi:hypothetical protein
MFMIPTPPLRRETEAIAARSNDSTRKNPPDPGHLGEVLHRESSSRSGSRRWRWRSTARISCMAAGMSSASEILTEID